MPTAVELKQHMWLIQLRKLQRVIKNLIGAVSQAAERVGQRQLGAYHELSTYTHMAGAEGGRARGPVPGE